MELKDLPAYQCHKVVRAAKIRGVHVPGSRAGWDLHLEGVELPVDISDAWYQKHQPTAGGYYVVYEDGYTSFSPADAFEAGYTKVTG